MPGLADLVNGVSQGVLVLGLESNIEIDSGVIGRKTQAEPVVRDVVPLVFYNHIVWWCTDSEGCGGTTEEHGRKDGEHRESEVVHDCKKATRCK